MYSGKNLKSLRRMKDLSQDEVAGKLGMSQQAYSKLEKQDWIDAAKINDILQAISSSRQELDFVKSLEHRIVK